MLMESQYGYRLLCKFIEIPFLHILYKCYLARVEVHFKTVKYNARYLLPARVEREPLLRSHYQQVLWTPGWYQQMLV